MRPGDVLGERFELRELTGAGGMGAVYRAHDRRTGQATAVKAVTGRTQLDAARFTREIELLRGLHHDGIVHYVAHGKAATGEAFLVMEWLDGEDLAARLARGPLSLQDSLRLASGVADALGAAHARGIVHRDIKPSNLFLRAGDVGRVVVLDFGVARAADMTTLSTSTGTILGTPTYMAPEQLRASHEADARADVYSLGTVLFECLTGRPAFGGAHAIAVLAKVLLEEAPRVADLGVDVPDSVDLLLQRMLSKDPGARPADARAVFDALAAIGDGHRARRASPSVELPALTRGEQQLLCVVLAAPEGDASEPAITVVEPTFEQAATMPAHPIGTEEALALAVAPFEARLERLMDGSVVAILVGHGAATDQAARGARCALVLRALLPEARIALATGRGVVAGHLPVGEVIDAAASLIAGELGDVRRVRLDDVTAGLLDATFEVVGSAKGLWLSGARPVLHPPRSLLGRPAPFVGRERELAVLMGIFEECEAESAPRVVIVTAGPGVGKSRLRHELLAKLALRSPPVTTLISRGNPMGVGAPFSMVAPLLRQTAMMVDGEPLDTRRRKLAARVSRHIAVSEERRVTEFLGEIIATPFPDDDSPLLRAARREPLVMGDQMLRAWQDFLAAEAGTTPTVVVLEDLQWGDQASISYLDLGLRVVRERPWVILALARPEVRTLFPDLWSEQKVTHLELGGLSRRASERLVRSVLGVGVDSKAVERVVEQAEGNALFLEELIRAVADGKGEVLPPTVLAMLQARLESFDPERRRVLRAASVFGQVFWTGGVEALLGRGAERSVIGRHVSALVEQEVISPRHPSRFPLEREYMFRHAIVREAAYGMLTDADKKVGHRVARAWLERASESDPMVLAEHCERGGEPTLAVAHYLAASRLALEGSDMAQAIARADRSIACGAVGDDRGNARLLQAMANHWSGTVDEVARCAAEAAQYFREGEAGWFDAMGWSAWASIRLGQANRVPELVAKLRAVTPLPGAATAALVARCTCASQLVFVGGDYASALALMALIEQYAQSTTAPLDPQYEGFVSRARAAVSRLTTNDPAERARHHAAAADAFERAGDVRSACRERINLGNAQMYLGNDVVAAEVLERALPVAEHFALRPMKAYASLNLGVIASRRGEHAHARTRVTFALEEFRALGDTAYAATSGSYLSYVLLVAGDVEGAKAAAAACLEAAWGKPVERAFALSVAAAVDLAQGDVPRAFDRASEAQAELDRLGTIEDGEHLVRLTYAETVRAAKGEDAFRVAIRAAQSAVLAKADSIGDRGLRERFLGIPENARTISLARAAG